MTTLKILEYLTLLIGFYMAWNIGANDVANAISTSVGSKALHLKKAIIIAAILEFLGAFLLGGKVSQTIQSGIVNPQVFEHNYLIFIYGMIASLLATGIWLNIASYFKLPVSTTHAIVGAVLGFGAIIGGMHAVHWSLVGSIAISWIITPFLSGLISYFVFSLLQKKILYALSPIDATKKYIPLLVFFSIFVFSFSLISTKLTEIQLRFNTLYSFLISIFIAAIFSTVSYFLVKRIKITSCTVVYHHPNQLISLEKAKMHLERTRLNSKGDTFDRTSKLLEDVGDMLDEIKSKTIFSEESSEYYQVEKSFGYLQVVSLCLVAFAHGSNDVANAIGPVAAVIQTIFSKSVIFSTNISPWILFLGGAGIVAGLATWGWRVVETIGHKITVLTPTRGFSAEFAAATTILLASKFGMPISTTHALVGAVLGVGLAKGLSALNLKTLRDVVLSWVVTIPICAIFTILTFYIIKLIFS
ncbi:MAG: inorganic phosphate transporter [Parachlamydiales bacterium]|nr:inorganic phosphate transporter [Parachlamydiales bacterium]